MTYKPDQSQYDAFGRQRVSGTGQRLDVEFIYDKSEEYFDEMTNGGSASVTHNANGRDLTLLAGATTSGHYAWMSSYPVPYTPGNSQFINMTGVLDLAGIGGGLAQVFLRSKVTGSVVEEVIDQNNWTDTVSGVDWSKSQLFEIDFQSLKVGEIRFCLGRGGNQTTVAQIDNDNEIDSGYWQTPNLPVYWKIYNDATYTYMELGYGTDDNAVGFRYRIAANASATMKAICCTVKSEGGLNLRDMGGIPKTIDRGITVKTVSTTLVPVISIRSKATFNSFENLMLAIPSSIFIQADESIRYAIIYDCSLTNASWNDVDGGIAESCMEFDVAATAFTNGHEVHSGYVYGSSTGAKGTIDAGAGGEHGVLGKTVLWNRQNGSETGILTIAAIKSGVTDSDVLAGFRWEEIR